MTNKSQRQMFWNVWDIASRSQQSPGDDFCHLGSATINQRHSQWDGEMASGTAEKRGSRQQCRGQQNRRNYTVREHTAESQLVADWLRIGRTLLVVTMGQKMAMPLFLAVADFFISTLKALSRVGKGKSRST
jgi:hypothetical protein